MPLGHRTVGKNVLPRLLPMRCLPSCPVPLKGENPIPVQNEKPRVSIENPWKSKSQRVFPPRNFPVPVHFYVRGDSGLFVLSAILFYYIE